MCSPPCWFSSAVICAFVVSPAHDAIQAIAAEDLLAMILIDNLLALLMLLVGGLVFSCCIPNGVGGGFGPLTS